MSEPIKSPPAQCICRNLYRLFHGQTQFVRSHNPQCPEHGKPNHLVSIPHEQCVKQFTGSKTTQK